jgi:hypothetical protein
MDYNQIIRGIESDIESNLKRVDTMFAGLTNSQQLHLIKYILKFPYEHEKDEIALEKDSKMPKKNLKKLTAFILEISQLKQSLVTVYLQKTMFMQASEIGEKIMGETLK